VSVFARAISANVAARHSFRKKQISNDTRKIISPMLTRNNIVLQLDDVSHSREACRRLLVSSLPTTSSQFSFVIHYIALQLYRNTAGNTRNTVDTVLQLFQLTISILRRHDSYMANVERRDMQKCQKSQMNYSNNSTLKKMF